MVEGGDPRDGRDPRWPWVGRTRAQGAEYVCVWMCSVVIDSRAGEWEGGRGHLGDRLAGCLAVCLRLRLRSCLEYAMCLFGLRAAQRGPELLDALLHPPLGLSTALRSVCYSTADIKVSSVLSCCLLLTITLRPHSHPPPLSTLRPPHATQLRTQLET